MVEKSVEISREKAKLWTMSVENVERVKPIAMEVRNIKRSTPIIAIVPMAVRFMK